MSVGKELAELLLGLTLERGAAEYGKNLALVRQERSLLATTPSPALHRF